MVDTILRRVSDEMEDDEEVKNDGRSGEECVMEKRGKEKGPEMEVRLLDMEAKEVAVGCLRS